jgi:uncharacterized membrane protein YfcA
MSVFLGLTVTLSAGVALGLFGGGGSLLVVPALVYLFGRPPVEATAYSLVMVGAASLVGTYLHWMRRPIPFRQFAVFAVPSVAAAFFVRAVLLPKIPEILGIGSVAIRRDLLFMLAFAVFAAASGTAMLRRQCCLAGPGVMRGWAVPVGIATGALTALLGAGGGFVVLPALILLVGLPIEQAVGASLATVAGQSIAGAVGAVSVIPGFDVRLAFVLTGTMLLGVTGGVAAADYVAPARLRRAFAFILLIVAVAMTIQQLS